MSLSLDLSSLTAVPKWRSDWNTAERRAIEQAKALRTMDKSNPQVVMDWVIKWVAVVVSSALDSMLSWYNVRFPGCSECGDISREIERAGAQAFGRGICPRGSKGVLR